jgi:uncharacterized protein (DUF4415 family)
MCNGDQNVEMQDEYDFSQAQQGPAISPSPGKTRITIRIDKDILEWFRKQVHQQHGGNYQINEALRFHIRRSMEPLRLSLEPPQDCRDVICEASQNPPSYSPGSPMTRMPCHSWCGRNWSAPGDKPLSYADACDRNVFRPRPSPAKLAAHLWQS